MITRLVSCVIIGDAPRSRATHLEQMNWQGKDSRRLVQQRVETDAASLLVSGNIISIHVGRQHIHLAEQQIGHRPKDKKNSQNKLFLIETAREYFSEIHRLVGTVGAQAEPLGAVIQFPVASCSSKRMAHLSPSTDSTATARQVGSRQTHA